LNTLIDWWYPESLLRMTASRATVGVEFDRKKEPPAEGAKPVYWLVDTQWIHKGWDMPEVV